MLTKRCAGCSEPGVDLCRRCRFTLVASPPIVTPAGIVAATEFSGLAKNLIVGLKYRNRRRLAYHLAEQLSRRLDPTQIDIITWAPTSGHRAGRRGYDQAELLARALAARWRKPCRRMLFRRHGQAQTGRTRDQRLHGPEFASRPLGRPPRVLVVDDVVTTGATLLAARVALLAAGARSVVLAAVAATPDTSTPIGPPRSMSRPHPTREARLDDSALAEALRRAPLGLNLAWASSIASSAPVKARS